jgi:hypothetical protein
VLDVNTLVSVIITLMRGIIACMNHSLLHVEITVVSVVIKFVRFKITMRVKITLFSVKITLILDKITLCV